MKKNEDRGMTPEEMNELLPDEEEIAPSGQTQMSTEFSIEEDAVGGSAAVMPLDQKSSGAKKKSKEGRTLEERGGYKNPNEGVRNLKEQMQEEGRQFYVLLFQLMADPQPSIHALYKQKPKIAFIIAILLNLFLLSFYKYKLSGEAVTRLGNELGINTLTTALIFGALFFYLRVRVSELKWEDALAVLGIANFPVFPCILGASVFAFFGFKEIAQLLYLTGGGWSFLFVFLCFIEVFEFPVKRSIYAIPAIFLGSEFVIRTIAIF